MKRIAIGILASSMLLAGGCVAGEFKDIEIDSATNPRVDLSGYSTYSWGGSASILADRDDDWTPRDLDVEAEIRFLIDRELRSRGWTEVASSPDAIVVYAVGVDMNALELKVDRDNRETFQEVPKGGVLVAMADPNTRQVMWAGGAVADVQEEPSVKQTKRRLDYAITNIFREFTVE
ncbi:MAG: DUF4136 domain-containing protein [Planctomycetota bacterium]